MIFLLPFRWRVRIYQWRADRDQRRRINLRARYPMVTVAYPSRGRPKLVTRQAV